MARQTHVLVAVPQADAKRYHASLRDNQDIAIRIVTDINDAMTDIANRDNTTDVLVVSQSLPQPATMVNDLRHVYPRLLIVIVDEEADFAIPGQADDISTTPFVNDDLVKRIQRLMSDRQLETLRADSLPAVRTFAKKLRAASGELGKLQAAAGACREMGYDYVAFYRVEKTEPIQVGLKAQDGAKAIRAVAPEKGFADDIIGWVAQHNQSRIASPDDEINHPLVKKGRLGAVACIPLNISNVRYGVMVACREMPGSVSKENILMLELISAQLTAALSKEVTM
jgi:hypothetical protein